MTRSYAPINSADRAYHVHLNHSLAQIICSISAFVVPCPGIHIMLCSYTPSSRQKKKTISHNFGGRDHPPCLSFTCSHDGQARFPPRKVHGALSHAPRCCGAKGCRRRGGHFPNTAHHLVSCSTVFTEPRTVHHVRDVQRQRHERGDPRNSQGQADDVQVGIGEVLTVSLHCSVSLLVSAVIVSMFRTTRCLRSLLRCSASPRRSSTTVLYCGVF